MRSLLSRFLLHLVDVLDLALDILVLDDALNIFALL